MILYNFMPFLKRNPMSHISSPFTGEGMKCWSEESNPCPSDTEQRRVCSGESWGPRARTWSLAGGVRSRQPCVSPSPQSMCYAADLLGLPNKEKYRRKKTFLQK